MGENHIVLQTQNGTDFVEVRCPLGSRQGVPFALTLRSVGHNPCLRSLSDDRSSHYPQQNSGVDADSNSRARFGECLSKNLSSLMGRGMNSSLIARRSFAVLASLCRLSAANGDSVARLTPTLSASCVAGVQNVLSRYDVTGT